MVLMNGWIFVRIEPAIVSPWWTERRRRRGGRSRSSASESLSNRNGSWRWRRGVPRERALEHLSDRIWRLHQRGEAYGLALRGITRPVQRGRAHRDACLQMLALA